MKLSSRKKLRKLMLKNCKPNKTPEDKRINKEEKEGLTNQKDSDLEVDNYYLNLKLKQNFYFLFVHLL